jgi:hypothetical protein
MFLEEEGVPAKTTSLAPVFICAGLSVFFLNSGLLSMFFLVPLGYAILARNSLWPSFLAAAVINFVFCMVTRLILRNGSANVWLEIFYFTTLFLCFSWIMGGTRFRTAYRFILASAASAAAFLLYVNSPNSGFYRAFENMAEILSSVLAPSSEGDQEVKRSAMHQMLTSENILEITKNILLRGGALLSTSFIFFINRHIAYTVLWIAKKQKRDQGLTAFFAPPNTIWVLSGAVASIFLTRLFKAEVIEIMAWNVFVVCAIIFLAQGAGILMYILARRTFAVRVFAGVLVILAVISPVLNTIAIAALLLLGVAENWLPFRAAKEGQAPTPGL